MYFCDAPAKNKAFRAHVLPVLDYASTVWNSHTHKNIFTLQKIQSHGSRWMWGSRFNCHNHTWSKSSIVNEVVNSIYISFYMVQVSHNSYHLWYISLSHLFALSNNFTFSYSLTRSHSLSLQCKQPSINSYRFFPFPLMIFSWNSVTHEMISGVDTSTCIAITDTNLKCTEEGLGNTIMLTKNKTLEN